MDDDLDLMLRVANGDHDAFGRLVDRHLARAVALAHWMLGRHAEAEEVAQDAFLKVWTHAPRWRHEGASFRTWLSRVVINLCIDRKRRPAPAPLEAAGDPPLEGPDAVDVLTARQEARQLHAALAKLPLRQRAALALSYWQGLSNHEAAQTLNISDGALESLLVRARRTLRAELESGFAHLKDEP